MFQITKQRIGNDLRHAVVGEVGASLITVSATSEIQACEIARLLNEAAGIEVEDLVEVANAADLHAAMEDIIRRPPRGLVSLLRGEDSDDRPSDDEIRAAAGTDAVTAEEEAAWRDFDTRR